MQCNYSVPVNPSILILRITAKPLILMVILGQWYIIMGAVYSLLLVIIYMYNLYHSTSSCMGY